LVLLAKMVHSRRTRSPSKWTVPSPAVAVIGTAGPGSRNSSLGALGVCHTVSTSRISSAKYSAAPVRPLGIASR
jgi:hypothetical protein